MGMFGKKPESHRKARKKFGASMPSDAKMRADAKGKNWALQRELDKIQKAHDQRKKGRW